MTVRLSKSKFVAGCQCLRRLYWQAHERELAEEPDRRPSAGCARQGGQTKMSVRNAMELDAAEKQVDEFMRSYGSGTSGKSKD